MQTKKTGWASIEKGEKKGAAKAPQAAKAKEPKHRSAKPTRKPKEVKPPFGSIVGRRKDSGEYELTREGFDSVKDLLKYVTDTLNKETHSSGLREVMISVRPEAK